MKGIAAFLAALLATTAAAHAQEVGDGIPTASELQARIDALEQELQASEQRQAAAQASAEQPPPAAGILQGWWDNTTIGGTAFLDLSNIEHTSDGVKQPDTGTNFDLKRFYVAIDHKFDDVWSADITTDVTYDGTTKASQIYIKKAYLQAKAWDELLVRECVAASCVVG